MKVSSLFDLITDSRDLLDLFARVETSEQLVSRLERLKRQGTDELLECIQGLRGSVTSALDDTLEMSAVLDESDEMPSPELDAELDKIAAEAEDAEDAEDAAENPEEKQNPPEPPPAEDPKIDVPPAG